MKKQLISILTLFLLVVIGCSENNAVDKSKIKWEEKIETAIKIAKEENKAILVNFTGSDWCVWCKKLDGEVFSQAEFAEYANNNLILVKLDFPRSIQQSSETKQYNNSLAQKYGIRGFPTILIFDKNGNPVAQTGYQPGGAANYVNHIKSILQNKS